MKKYLNAALIFALYGLAAGVYFREFTKFNSFTERTMLGMAHPHILMLGLGGFLTVALFVKVLAIKDDKMMKLADVLYAVGITVASLMMLLRGTFEVAGIEIVKALDASISGVAGLSHIATAIGMLRYLTVFKKHAKK